MQTSRRIAPTYGPECFRSVNKQFYKIGLLLSIGSSCVAAAVVFGVELRRPLLDFHERVDYTQQQDGGSEIEGEYHRLRNHTGCRSILKAYPGEQEWEYVAYDRTGVAEEALYGVCKPFLALINHIAHQHFERLHGHVD